MHNYTVSKILKLFYSVGRKRKQLLAKRSQMHRLSLSQKAMIAKPLADQKLIQYSLAPASTYNSSSYNIFGSSRS